MDERRRNLAVGIFVLLGLGAVATMIVIFGRAPSWFVRGGTYPLYVQFPDVSGIRSGTLVTVKGMTIGAVDGLELRKPPPAGMVGPRPTEEAARMVVGHDVSVSVRLAINSEYLIPKGSTARTTEPMLGQGRPPIEIIVGPPDAEPLEAGAVLPGTVQRAMDSIFPPGVVDTFQTTARQIGDAAEALTPALEEARELLERRAPGTVDAAGGPQGNLSSAVARLDGTLKHFNDVLGDGQVKSQLRETVANIHQMSENGKDVMTNLRTAASDARDVMADARKFVTKADETLDTLNGRVTDVSRATINTLDRFDLLLDNLNTVAKQVSSGEGNLGRLVMDNKLYEALRLTAERLSLAVEEFRALVAEWRQGKVRVAL